MKLKSTALVAIVMVSFLAGAHAKNKNISAEIKVAGNCGSCEKRIEKAAYNAGAKMADWNSETQTLTIVYNPKGDRLEKIITSVLSTGHDVDQQVADKEVYDALPACCKYRDTKCTKE